METDQISISVGSVSIGPGHPILIQSMCNVSTMDRMASVDQCIRIFEAGGGLSRLSAGNIKEACNLKNIREDLNRKGYFQPISADVHFNPAIAFESAKWVEKVRINPGNFTNTDIEKPFLEFLNICRKNNTAIRIGVNHGSLSERIMEKYGDSPEGMVESALEYLRICKREKFTNVVVSLKSSNTRIMVYSNRLMRQHMEEENLIYPLHLGVTEAGEGESGRIRSAVGIGTLLNEGLGDTIRISLTEEPEYEIPVAKKLLQIVGSGERSSNIHKTFTKGSPVTAFKKRNSDMAGLMGGGQVPVVIAEPEEQDLQEQDGDKIIPRGQKCPEPDYYFLPDHRLPEDHPSGKRYILNAEAWILDEYPEKKYFPLFDLQDFLSLGEKSDVLNFVIIRQEDVKQAIEQLSEAKVPICLIYLHKSGLASRNAFLDLSKNCGSPVIIQASFKDRDTEMFQLRSSSELAWYFIDGYADGIWLNNTFTEWTIPLSTTFKILQACRARMSETDFIACPSCGRTLFNIQETLAEVKKATSHLKHLKIAVMGCIVNGPGEMADADYGYVGSGKGKISLYHQKEIVKINIRQEDAVRELVELIKLNGD